MKLKNTYSIDKVATLLGKNVTPANVLARIRRGSLTGYQTEEGEWRIPQSEIKRILSEITPCENCTQPALVYVIVKYHNHDRVEFELCENCAHNTEASYSRSGGVLEIVSYPLLGEGWRNW